MLNGIIAKCLPSVMFPTGMVSKPKNSLIIQYELAEIQNTMARLCASSALMLRVRQVMSSAMLNVGTTMMMPSVFQIMHQLMSLISQNRICWFSILRYAAGMAYTSSVLAGDSI